MSLYNDRILPALIHLACSRKPFMQQRRELVPRAYGQVLEIGMGSGLNLPFYQQHQVKSVIGLEPAERLRLRASKHNPDLPFQFEMLDCGAESLPLSSNSIDTVVVTFTMCTIPGIEDALTEMRRVLKPEGQLLFCEHGKSPDNRVQSWQDRLNPVWKRLAGGCHLNRDITGLISQAGFDIGQLKQQYLSGPKTLAYVSSGQAKPLR
jgi:ubiquinone/menaquinone biosynthesis C-methylase UbiE